MMTSNSSKRATTNANYGFDNLYGNKCFDFLVFMIIA